MLLAPALISKNGTRICAGNDTLLQPRHIFSHNTAVADLPFLNAWLSLKNSKQICKRVRVCTYTFALFRWNEVDFAFKLIYKYITSQTSNLGMSLY